MVTSYPFNSNAIVTNNAIQPTGGILPTPKPTSVKVVASASNPVVTSGALVNQPQKPKVSTTTISNSNKIAQVPSMIVQTNQLAQKGITTDPKTGISVMANGQVATPPEERDASGLLINPPGALYDRNTGKLLKPIPSPKTDTENADDGTTPVSPVDTSFEDDAIMRNLNEMQRQNDAMTSDLIQNIKQKFDQRRNETSEMTAKASKSLNNSLLMGGVTGQGSSSQYAPISSQGIVTANESYGIKQLAELDSQENDLIAQAKIAQATGKYKILEAKNAEIEKKRQEKIDLATKLNEDITKRNNEIREKNIQSSRDSAVADLVTQGITDPALMLDYLNYDEKGNKIGDYTAKEISETLKNISSNVGLGGDVGKLDQTAQLFFKLKNTKGGLPASILKLPTEGEQLLAFTRMLTGATTKNTTASGSGAGSVDSGVYKTDLDALIGLVPNLISSKNGKDSFLSTIKSARSDADKINAIAAVVLKNSPAPVRQDFINQTVAIKQIDKAINLIDQGVKSGIVKNGVQYIYNVFGKDFDPNLSAVNAYITSAIQPYRSSITGAAWGDQEDAEYNQLFGSTKYYPKELRERLIRVKEIMRDKSSSALQAQVNPLSNYNPFEINITGNTHNGVILPGDEDTPPLNSFSGISLPN